jgi:hypothetical protein
MDKKCRKLYKSSEYQDMETGSQRKTSMDNSYTKPKLSQDPSPKIMRMTSQRFLSNFGVIIFLPSSIVRKIS